MFCAKCGKPFPLMCTCPDRESRIKEVRQMVITKWCKKCDNHHLMCGCPSGDADFTMMLGDRDLGCGPFKNAAGSLTQINPKTGEVTQFRPQDN